MQDAIRGEVGLSPWSQIISFVSEYILSKGEQMELHPDCIYYLNTGKLVLGKRIIQEKEFVFGRVGRLVVALGRTSLLRMYTNKQRKSV